MSVNKYVPHKRLVLVLLALVARTLVISFIEQKYKHSGATYLPRETGIKSTASITIASRHKRNTRPKKEVPEKRKQD
jgi:hypothetical protein